MIESTETESVLANSSALFVLTPAWYIQTAVTLAVTGKEGRSTQYDH